MNSQPPSKFDLGESTLEDNIKNNKNIEDPETTNQGMENSYNLYASMQQSDGFKQFIKSLGPINKLTENENLDKKQQQEKEKQNMSQFIYSKYFDTDEIQNIMASSNLFKSKNQKEMKGSLVTNLFSDSGKFKVTEFGKGMDLSFVKEESKEMYNNKLENQQIQQQEQQQIKEDIKKEDEEKIQKRKEKVKFQLQHIGSVQSLDGEDLSKSETHSQQNGEEEGCNCKRSKCLKLYCECFRKNIVCTSKCRCNNCRNTEDNQTERENAMEHLINKNPDAFNSRIEILGNLLEKDNNYVGYKKGCNCKKTFCRKKYCECFNAGVKCTYLCKCENCMNGNCEDQNHQNQLIKGVDKIQQSYKFMSSESEGEETIQKKQKLNEEHIQNQILNNNNTQIKQDQRVLRKTQQRITNKEKEKERLNEEKYTNQILQQQQKQQQSQNQNQQQNQNEGEDEEDEQVKKIMEEPIMMQNFESN